MAVLYLVLTIAAFSSLGLVMRHGGRRGLAAQDIAAAIHFCGMALTGALILVLPLEKTFSSTAVGWGIVGGIGGGIASLLFVRAITIGHYGFSCTILYASFLIPVLFSIVFHGAAFGVREGSGIALILAALILTALAAPEEADGSEKRGKTGRWLTLILAACLLNGCPMIGQAMVAKQSAGGHWPFLFFTYASGGVLIACLLIRARSFNPRALLYGGAGAAGSITGILCTLLALQTIAPTVVYPVTMCGPLLVAALLSRFVFKEKLGLAGTVGVGCGLAGILVLGG